MSNLYKGSSIDAAYQGSVHWPAVSEEKIFKNWPIRNKNCLWRPCLLMDRDKISNLTTPVNHILKTHFFRQAFLSFLICFVEYEPFFPVISVIVPLTFYTLCFNRRCVSYFISYIGFRQVIRAHITCLKPI
jgi:hypothetical protein